MRQFLPWRPLVEFIKNVGTNGGVHWTRTPVLLFWLMKCTFIEPIRLLEEAKTALQRRRISKPPPIFILGFYRSGTTFLQELMNCDPALATPTIFQTILPEGVFLLEPWLKPLLQRVSDSLNMTNRFHRRRFEWDCPGEEDVALNSLCCPCDFNVVLQYPSRAAAVLNDHFLSGDDRIPRCWLGNHMLYTDKLQLKYPGRRLLLKSPANMARIALLLEGYPGAQFIFIQRDSRICQHSNKRLWEANKPFSLQRYSEAQVEEIIAEMHEVFHDRYHAEKHLLGPSQLVEITYEELIADPAGVLEGVYQALGLESTSETRMRSESLIQERADYEPIKHNL